MSRIVIIVTAASSLTLKDGSAHPTGFWAEELVVAHRDLVAAGHDITIAVPGGVRPTVDPGSLRADVVGDQSKVDELTAYLASIDDELAHPLPLDQVVASQYGALVLPGGHGPMADLATDATLGSLLTAANADGTLIAPFCHGPAALLSATAPDGGFTFAGRRLAVFTDEEELAGGLGESSPWFVAQTLSARGALVESGPAWTSHVVRDGNLISGQNPQSSAAVAAELVQALSV